MARFSPNAGSPEIAGFGGLVPAALSAVVTTAYVAPTAGGIGVDLGGFADAAERDAFIANQAELVVDIAALDTSFDLLVADIAVSRTAIVALNTAFEVIGLQTTV